MLQRLFQIIHLDAEMQITDRIGRRRQHILAAGEYLDELSFVKFQEHQLGPLALRLDVVNLLRAKGIAVPANAPSDIRYLECDMTET